MGFFSDIFGGGGSEANTENDTKTQNGTIQDNDGTITQVVGDGNTVTDAGAIKAAFNFGNNTVERAFDLTDTVAENSFDFASDVAEQLAKSEANALARMETVTKGSNSFISNYTKNSSERIMENITNYAGIALVVFLFILAYRKFK